MNNSDIFNNIFSKITPHILNSNYNDLTNVTWDNKLNKLKYNIVYFILEGEGLINISDTNYFPTKGKMILLPCNQYHFTKSVNNNHYKKYSCCFSATVGDRDIFDILSTPLCVNIKEYDIMENLFKELSENWAKPEKNISQQMHIYSTFFEILSLYFSNCESKSICLNTLKFNDDINIVIEYIHTNIKTHISIEDLAKISNFHPNYFIRMFKSIMGVSPIKYINNLRLGKMKDELLYTEKKISEIANDYEMTYKTFIQMFCTQYGISPSKLRQR